MKEFIIFLVIFLVVFGISLFIFNGRYIYAQIKYSFIGAPTAQNYAYLPKAIKDIFKQSIMPERLAIPSLGVEAPVVISQSSTEAGFQNDLQSGVIYMPGSSALNEKGTMVIMGHSSAYPWYKGQYGSIFALLNKLNVNDEILVFSKNKTYIYRVAGKEIKAPKDLVFQKQQDESALYLVSCWPVNTAWKRIVIKAVQALDKN